MNFHCAVLLLTAAWAVMQPGWSYAAATDSVDLPTNYTPEGTIRLNPVHRQALERAMLAVTTMAPASEDECGALECFQRASDFLSYDCGSLWAMYEYITGALQILEPGSSVSYVELNGSRVSTTGEQFKGVLQPAFNFIIKHLKTEDTPETLSSYFGKKIRATTDEELADEPLHFVKSLRGDSVRAPRVHRNSQGGWGESKTEDFSGFEDNYSGGGGGCGEGGGSPRMCSECTFNNEPGSTLCMICNSPLERRSIPTRATAYGMPPLDLRSVFPSAEGIACLACTYINQLDRTMCVMCGTRFDVAVPADAHGYGYGGGGGGGGCGGSEGYRSAGSRDSLPPGVKDQIMERLRKIVRRFGMTDKDVEKCASSEVEACTERELTPRQVNKVLEALERCLDKFAHKGGNKDVLVAFIERIRGECEELMSAHRP